MEKRVVSPVVHLVSDWRNQPKRVGFIRFVCMADTHGKVGGRNPPLDVPEGDVLIHAGDFNLLWDSGCVENFRKWILDQKHRHKLVVGGNHDRFLEKRHRRDEFASCSGFTLLWNSIYDVEGIRILGLKYRVLEDWMTSITDGPVDLIISHKPPLGISDMTSKGPRGCPNIRNMVEVLNPRVHVFGHVHDTNGYVLHGSTVCINATLMTGQGKRGRLSYAPIVFDFPIHESYRSTRAIPKSVAIHIESKEEEEKAPEDSQ